MAERGAEGDLRGGLLPEISDFTHRIPGEDSGPAQLRTGRGVRVGIECVSAGPEAGHLEKFCWFCDTEDESVATQTKRCLVVSSALIRAGRARRNGLTCTADRVQHEGDEDSRVRGMFPPIH